MSNEAQTWAKKQRTGGAVGKCLLLILANYADREGRCYAGQQRLAEDAECSERTVREWLGKFENEFDPPLIKREVRRRENGSRTSDYIILQLDDRPSQPADAAGDQPAKTAGDQPADNRQPHRQHLPGQNTTSRNKPSKVSQAEPVRQEHLRAALMLVLDGERADAVLDDRERQGRPLSIAEAQIVARHCDGYPNPNAAAEVLIATRYRGCRGISRLPSARQVAALRAGECEQAKSRLPGTIVFAEEPEAYAKAVELSGKRAAAVARSWTFAPEIAEAARAATIPRGARLRLVDGGAGQISGNRPIPGPAR